MDGRIAAKRARASECKPLLQTAAYGSVIEHRWWPTNSTRYASSGRFISSRSMRIWVGLRLTGDLWAADLGEEALESAAEQFLALARLRPRSRQYEGSDERDRRPRASATAAHSPTVAPRPRHRGNGQPSRSPPRRHRGAYEPSLAAMRLRVTGLRARHGRYRIANEARAGRGPRDLQLAARSHRAERGRGGGTARLAAVHSTLLLSRGAAASAEKKNPHRAASELSDGLSRADRSAILRRLQGSTSIARR
jgi:hypothetical protein